MHHCICKNKNKSDDDSRLLLREVLSYSVSYSRNVTTDYNMRRRPCLVSWNAEDTAIHCKFTKRNELFVIHVMFYFVDQTPISIGLFWKKISNLPRALLMSRSSRRYCDRASLIDSWTEPTEVFARSSPSGLPVTSIDDVIVPRRTLFHCLPDVRLQVTTLFRRQPEKQKLTRIAAHTRSSSVNIRHAIEIRS